MKNVRKYTLKKNFTISYYILMSIGVLLTIGRWLSVFDSEFLMINESFHYSISNFTLSLLFYLAIGLSWLTSGVKFHWIVILGMLIVIGNVFSETLMGFMNTTDILDAVYGTIGTTIAFTFLYFTKKYGLISVNSENE